VLAYSTVSQLGFMFMALGRRSYWVAVFPPVHTRLLQGVVVLGSGSVIHGMHGQQDMRYMGGPEEVHALHACNHADRNAGDCRHSRLGRRSSPKKRFDERFFSSKAVYAIGLTTAAMTAYYMFG
jgi:NADH-quinone oxidoreductase subunit L